MPLRERACSTTLAEASLRVKDSMVIQPLLSKSAVASSCVSSANCVTLGVIGGGGIDCANESPDPLRQLDWLIALRRNLPVAKAHAATKQNIFVDGLIKLDHQEFNLLISEICLDDSADLWRELKG